VKEKKGAQSKRPRKISKFKKKRRKRFGELNEGKKQKQGDSRTEGQRANPKAKGSKDLKSLKDSQKAREGRGGDLLKNQVKT